MWRVRHFFVAAAVLGAGIAVSACGGDSSPETPIAVPNPTETQPSGGKAEFIAQADSICAEASTSIEQFAAAGQGLTEADQIAQLRQGVVDQVKQLGPPSEDRATLDQFLTAMSAQVSAGEKIGLALQRGEDTAEFETELADARTQAETAAAGYGFQECGQPISSSGTAPSTVAPSGDSSASSGGVATTPSAPSSAPDTSSGTAGGTGSGTPDSSGTGSGTGGDTGSGTGGTTGNSGGVGPG